jgi:hypothetical protein
MLYPMANMDIRANSVKHLDCRFAAKVQQLEATWVRKWYYVPSLLAGAPILMLENTTTLLATAITNPWMQSKIMRETWIRASGSAY